MAHLQQAHRVIDGNRMIKARQATALRATFTGDEQVPATTFTTAPTTGRAAAATTAATTTAALTAATTAATTTTSSLSRTNIKTTATTAATTTTGRTAVTRTTATPTTSQTLATLSTSSSSSPSSSASAAASNSSSSSSSHTGVIVAVVVIVVLLVAAIGAYFGYKKYKNNKMHNEAAAYNKHDEDDDEIFGNSGTGHNSGSMEGEKYGGGGYGTLSGKSQSQVGLAAAAAGMGGMGALGAYEAQREREREQQQQYGYGGQQQQFQQQPSYNQPPPQAQFNQGYGTQLPCGQPQQHPYQQTKAMPNLPPAVPIAPAPLPNTYPPSPSPSNSTATNTRENVRSPFEEQMAAAPLVGATQQKEQQNPFQDSPGQGKIHQVLNTFEPAQSDELHIYPGDKIQVLIAYDDGWALGINLSSPPPHQKGVFPFDCVGPPLNGNGAAPQQPQAAFASPSDSRALTPPVQQHSQDPLSNPSSYNSVPPQLAPLRSDSPINLSDPSTRPTQQPIPNMLSPGGSTDKAKRTSSLIASRDASLFVALGEVLGRDDVKA